MKFILAKKLKMSTVFDEEGKAMPTTLVEAGPILVTGVKTKEKDGYEALQVGFGWRKFENLKKPVRGQIIKSLGRKQGIKWLREFRVGEDELKKYKVGDEIKVDIFKKGELVKVSAKTKGRGFQGGVKRWGFAGGPRTHGQKHSEREVGSIANTGSGKVRKGKRMPGHMGNRRVSVKNLEIVLVEPDKNILGLKGAVPGPAGGLVEIQSDQ